jgi:hypothetical protein
MRNSATFDPSPSTLTRSALAALRSGSRSRVWLLIVAGALIAAGLGFNWSWVVAAGMAPLLLSAAPCVVMCALGLCMIQMTGRAAPIGSAPDQSSQTNSTSSPRPDVDRLLDAKVSRDGSFDVE